MENVARGLLWLLCTFSLLHIPYVQAISGTDPIKTIAGNGATGPATAIPLGESEGIAVDVAGNLYFADRHKNRVRKIDRTGSVITIAGKGNTLCGYSGDGGPANAAELCAPTDLAVDKNGNVYIADVANSRIRKVDSKGIISTVAGNGGREFGGDGGPADAASLVSPYYLTLDESGNLYVMDYSRIRKIDSAGIITTVAGDGNYAFSGDGGPATSASLTGFSPVAVDRGGNLYLADDETHRIRMVNSAGVIKTIAGTGVDGYSGDGGPATAAALSTPKGITFDSTGNLFSRTAYASA